jgi:hypothetical protein
MDKGFYTFNNIRKLLWNARAHWLITNYNRLRLKEVGEPALHLGIAPTEDHSVQFVETTELLFGFDYCDFVLNELDDEVTDAALEALEIADIF